MQTSDVVGFSAFIAFGWWWILFPDSVIPQTAYDWQVPCGRRS
jgi:succinate-acetate transporter protein